MKLDHFPILLYSINKTYPPYPMSLSLTLRILSHEKKENLRHDFTVFASH